MVLSDREVSNPNPNHDPESNPTPTPTPHQAHPDGEGGEAATRAAAAGRTAEMTFIPPMIAVGAVHHHLIQAGPNPNPNPQPQPQPHPQPQPQPYLYPYPSHHPGGPAHGHLDHRGDGAGV
jgi:hypothetical protein